MLQIRIKFTQCCKLIMLNYFPLAILGHNIHQMVQYSTPLVHIQFSFIITKLVKN